MRGIGARRAAWRAVVVAALGMALLASSARAQEGTASVTDWLAVTADEIAAHRTNPPRAARCLAIVSVAMDRAAGHGVPAIHGAAAAALGDVFPDRAQHFAARATGMAGGAPGQALGRSIGEEVAADSHRDGSGDPWTGTVPAPAPGTWQALPGQSPLEPTAGAWRPWNIGSAAELLPPPPPAPGTDGTWEREVREVYDVGRALTDDQRAVALFWADGAGTVTPPGHWNQIAIDLVAGARLSPPRAARALAAVNTAQADAFIAAWNAKYVYWSERPVTAIRRMIDPGWSPLIAPQPFPSYVSGHSSTSGAASTVLAMLFPERARELAALAEEAAASRLYGGIHYVSDNEAGLALGQAAGRAAIAAYGLR